MEMEQSGENTEMRTKKNVGQKLVTEKRKTKNPLRCNGFFVYMINSVSQDKPSQPQKDNSPHPLTLSRFLLFS